MSAPAWMPLHVGVYLADTGHLSTLEHGAYMLLIMHYWQNDGLPADETKLARIARLPEAEWASIRDTIAALFKPDWRHKRVDSELVAARQMISKRSAAGKAGASARYSNRMAEVRQERTVTASAKSGATSIHGNRIAEAQQSHTDRIADRIANAEQSNSIVRVGLPNKDLSSTSCDEKKEAAEMEQTKPPEPFAASSALLNSRLMRKAS